MVGFTLPQYPHYCLFVNAVLNEVYYYGTYAGDGGAMAGRRSREEVRGYSRGRSPSPTKIRNPQCRHITYYSNLITTHYRFYLYLTTTMGKHMTITNMTSRHDDMIIHVMVPVLSVGTHRGMLEKFLLPFLPFLLFSYFNYRWQGSSFSRQLKGLGARWGRGGKTKDTVTEEKASYLVRWHVQRWLQILLISLCNRL